MRNLLFLLLITSISFAQNANRKYISHSWKNNILEIKTSDGSYLIKPYSDKIVETSFVPNGETFNPNSHAVVKTPEKGWASFSKTDNSLSLITKGITVVINKSPFKITYSNLGKVLLSEKMGYTKVNDSTQTLSFNLDNSEVLYGGGARALGMNRRGNRLQLYNRAHYGYETKAELMNFCIPLVMSSKLYAVHFDNAAIGYLDLDSKKDNTLTYETISGRKTYQVIVGNTWSELVSKYTDLTGKQPLLPRWSLGNFSSRFGYHSQEDVENTIKKFEQNNIPVDAIILDLYWFGKGIKNTMGNLDWDKDNFPNPNKMISDLNAKGIKTILITEPFILTTSTKWQEAVDKNVLVKDKFGKPATWDFYFGNTSVVDIFKPEGKDWFWNVYKRLINQGVGGMWGDLGEPEVFPSKAITAGGKADEVHNIYGHNWAKLIADGYKKDFPTQRPFILMRAGYSGSQRFGMVPWSGDVSRSWGGLQSQMEIALQMGMQGLGYMHSDLGGFAGDYFDNELYLRWLQYGVFNPIFRPHAQEDVASEVARKDIATMAKAKKQVDLRYQLMPYNYTLSFDNNQKGTPLMRPLFFEEPALTTVSGTYFWGNDFLVTPITKAGLTSTEVYFPKSSNWFDFYTNEKHLAGTTESVKVNEDYIPTFVRGGSFIPMIETIQNTSKYSLANFNLHYYFDESVTNSSGKLYNDDGTTPNAFEKGQYEILNFNSTNNNKSLVIKIAAVTGKNFTSTDKNVSILIHNIKAKRIFVNGQERVYKTFHEPLQVNVTMTKGTPSEIKIEY
ncbi:glycoside hydrolase family 31 protein [Flavobacterium sangjuense]|uniref:Oligosaccharide 4-alpha-D-glucosyltransferase n=1 Tax=Flavobacterium sangjuense TaxID=2518177 RepID=A0A4V1CBX1_9FLAO|nr:TIM-barrel domain-containing protein [Flavobacterium sangjuense]QBZ97464.1 Oligosaccharide 4-alpha-D-glucosyltransferase [Flavobacterium sangjuense]